MTDALIDDLVADLIATESKHVEVSRAAIERLTTQYPELTERYGDWNLGLDFRGPGARLVRADVHRTLRDKGMSQRQIAAVTGAAKTTIQRDLQPEPVHLDRPDAEEPVQMDHLPDSTPAGPYWPVLGQSVKPLRGLTDTPAADVAASVPSRRRAGTAKSLRRLGTYLGAIALELEGMEQ